MVNRYAISTIWPPPAVPTGVGCNGSKRWCNIKILIIGMSRFFWARTMTCESKYIRSSQILFLFPPKSSLKSVFFVNEG